MTQNYHTPHGIGTALNSSVFNQVYSDLDGAITANAVGTGNDGEVLISDSATSSGRKWGDATPNLYVAGYRVSVTGATVTVSAGVARDDTNVESIRRSTSITIDPLNVGVNGLDGGSLASSTWYRVWVIKNVSSGAVGGLMSTSASPSLPAGYTVKRRVGWVRTSSAGVMWRQETLTSDLTRVVTYLEDTTATPFAIMVAQNVNNATWDTVSATAVVPSSARVGVVYFDRANAGGILKIRVGSSQVLNFAPMSINGAVVNIPLAGGQTFEMQSSATGNEVVNMHVQGYLDDLAV